MSVMILNRMLKHFVPVLIILLVVAAFFWRLFFPEPRFIFTVESLGSDLWNYYYPAREFLSRSLKRGELPFWSKDTGTGFPYFAESQSGALHLPTFLLYRFLPTWLAWNVSYVTAFFLAFWGAFLFFRKVGLGVLASLFAGFSFSFSGYFVSHMIHIAPLQNMALMPWLFLAAELVWEKATPWRILGLAAVLAQQIFAGHFQWVFISVLGLFVYHAVRVFGEERATKKLGLLGLGVVLGGLLAAPQLLPLLEIRELGRRRTGLSAQEIFTSPYAIRNLVTFVLPEFFGTPKDGSWRGELGYYWENTAYVGILPLLLFPVVLFSRSKRRWEWGVLILGALSLILVFGQYSPLYFLLTLPGFSVFRAPSRFLILTVFSLAGLAGGGLDRVLARFALRSVLRRGVGILAFGVAIFDLFRFGYDYHTLVPVREVLASPETARIVPAGERIYSTPAWWREWKAVFFRNGWQDSQAFLYFRNALFGNINLLFERSNVQLTGTALTPFREGSYAGMLPFFLEGAGTRYVVSPEEIVGDERLRLWHVVPAPRDDLPEFRVYEFAGGLERVRMAWEYQVVEGPEEAAEVIRKGGFPVGEKVLLESDPGLGFERPTEWAVEVVEESDQRMVVRTRADTKGLLVVADAYYPDWRATIDGEETVVLPANANQRAVVVPAGEHTVALRFVPRMFSWGLWVSGGALLVFGVAAAFWRRVPGVEESA